MDLKVYALLNAKIKELTGGSGVDLSNYYTKEEADAAITAKVAEIVANAPEDFDTLKELSDWISSHEESAAAMNSAINDLDTNKVDKVTGKSLISDAEIKRLANVDNYDDTALKADIATNETNISNANTQIADIYNRCGGGKNLFKTPTNVSSVYRNLTFSWDSDGVLTVTGIPSFAGDVYIPNYPYITTGSQFTAPYDCKMYALYSDTHADMWVTAHGYSADGRQFYTSIGSSGISLSAGDRLAGLYFRTSNTTTDYNFTVKFMIIPNNIKDVTYVPYIPTNTELQGSLSAITNGWTTTTLELGASSNIDLYFVREDCQVVMCYNAALKRVIIDIDFKTKNIPAGNGANFVNLDAKYIPSKKIRSYISTSDYTFYATVNPETKAVSVGVSRGSVTADTENNIRLEWTII